MKNVQKIILTLCAIVILGSALTACNTVNGAGKDISAGGRAISNASHQ